MRTNIHTFENQYFINGRPAPALRYAEAISIAKLNARIAALKGE